MAKFLPGTHDKVGIFGSLLGRVAERYELEVADAKALREENRRLREEIQRLQSFVDVSRKADGSTGSLSLCLPPLPPRGPILRRAASAPFPEEGGPGEIRRGDVGRRSSLSLQDVPAGMPTDFCRVPGRRRPPSRGRGPQEPSPRGAFRGHCGGFPSAEASIPGTVPESPREAAHLDAGGSLAGVEQVLSGSPKLRGRDHEWIPECGSADNSFPSSALRRASIASTKSFDDNYSQASPLGMKVSRKSSASQLDKAVAELDQQNVNKLKQRLRHVLKLEGGSLTNMELMGALQRKGKPDYSLEKANSVLNEFKALGQNLLPPEENPDEGHAPSSIPLDVFVQLLAMPDLVAFVQSDLVSEVAFIQNVLLNVDVEEVIASISRVRRKCQGPYSPSCSHAGSGTTPKPDLTPKRLAILNVVVGVTIVLSIIVLGVSMDVEPNWIGWLVVEALIGTVFVVEMVMKVVFLGWRGYLWDDNWQWNWLDVLITLLTLVDLAINLATRSSESAADLSVAKLTVVLRALRLTRIARLVKLLRTPILSELANMLAGFLIGVPCMLWVLVFLTLVFYSLGMVFRQVVGPEPDVSYVSRCGGGGDVVEDHENPDCQLHYLYGEEFFGTVWSSMFTVFRCVLGDCSTKGGQSLATHFSQGYGFTFDLCYCVGMVIVIFGLFNIITAIFVESTISGLKYNDVQRKYANMYEARYVHQKLEALVKRIYEIKGIPRFSSKYPEHEFGLTEEDFEEVMEDDMVSSILQSLDVVMNNHVGLFDVLDSDNDGRVTIPEIVATLMKVRGELQKSDLVASWVAMRSLHEEFMNFEKLSLENHRVILEHLEGHQSKQLAGMLV